MNQASCLCGDVAWEIEGPLELMSHCHCSRCRKRHGTPFATYVSGPADRFRLRGAEGVVRWESSPGFFRAFCGRCGSTIPADPWEGRIFLPAGNFHEDIDARPLAHIFVASKAPWYEIRDELPRFDAYPEGFDARALPDRPPLDPPGRPRGSCLCGAVTFVVDGEPLRAINCHCGRCRKARSAAHASNLFTTAGGLRFTRGEAELRSYKVPGARYFMQVFCRTCGSSMPRIDRERDLAVVPMGALDDDPGIRPQAHIFVGSKAPWYTIADDLPQHADSPPAP
ncbi:MAG: GFA family protein [Candidatus Binatia bacterium]